MKKHILISLLLVASIASVFSQQKLTPEEYIETYKWVAMEHRFEYKIPASITLSQGFLESGFGNSRLAVEANNHFGIKCHSDWTGKRIYKDDDSKNECFRVYDNAEESYKDHALFLTGKSRYEFLFSYDVTDYKSWAKGLKKAGYATNPQYPDRLMELIDRYDLAQYDKISEKDYNKMRALNGMGVIAVEEPIKKTTKQKGTNLNKGDEHSVLHRNRVKCIIVHQGETVVDIAQIFDIMPKQIYKYNDLPKGAVLESGMILYLQPKRKKGDLKLHLVLEGESYWEISQIHGMRLSSLLKINGLDANSPVVVGQRLILRKEK